MNTSSSWKWLGRSGLGLGALLTGCAAPSTQRLAPTPSDTGGPTGDSGFPEPRPSVLQRGADLNGDGFDDLVVSAPYQDDGGVLSVFAGGPNGLRTRPELELRGTRPSSLLGVPLELVGDLNGDGFDELAAGSTYTSPEPEFVSIWFGATDFVLGPPLELTEDTAGGVFGASLARVGDATGDGFDDLLIGSFTGSALVPGKAWLVRGGPSFDGADRLELVPTTPSPGFGTFRASAASDVNGDGHPDLLVGTAWDTAGTVDVFFGGPGMDGVSDQVLTGPYGFGGAIAGIGDFDGDGLADVAIGTPRDASDVGSVSVYRGTSTGLDPVPLGTCSRPGRTFFGASVAGAGDVNGDGAPDFVVGEWYHHEAGRPTGRAHVFFGGAGADYDPDVTIDADTRELGQSVGAFDVNNDGLGDVIVSAWDYYGNAADHVFVYEGGTAFDGIPETDLVDPEPQHVFGFGIPGGF